VRVCEKGEAEWSYVLDFGNWKIFFTLVKRRNFVDQTFFKDMDDFNGKFCKNGSFPVIKSVRDCFNKKPKTTTRPPTTTTLSISQESDQTTDAFESASNPDYESEKEEDTKSSSSSSTNTTTHFAVHFLLVYFLSFDLF